jgi:hypothetical protein
MAYSMPSERRLLLRRTDSKHRLTAPFGRTTETAAFCQSLSEFPGKMRDRHAVVELNSFSRRGAAENEQQDHIYS